MLYDELPPAEAIVQCWTLPGKNPRFHRRIQKEVTFRWPLLVHHIGRLIAEQQGD